MTSFKYELLVSTYKLKWVEKSLGAENRCKKSNYTDAMLINNTI